MSPYRTPASVLPVESGTMDRPFAFRRARLRIGVHRFEIAFWDPIPLLCVGMMSLPVFVLPWRILLPLLVVAIVLGLLCRCSFVVTRRTSWVAHSVLGVRWKTQPTGRSPAVDGGGWDWDEISIIPSEVALQIPLLDGGRAGLVEWSDMNFAKSREADLLRTLMREQIARLHAEVLR